MASYSFKSVGVPRADSLAASAVAPKPAFGPKLPLELASSGADPIAAVTDFGQQTSQNLRSLLLTEPGERLVLTAYGTGLGALAAEFSDLESFDEAALRTIKRAVERWMPHVELVSYESKLLAAGTLVSVTLSYAVPAAGLVAQRLVVELPV